MAEKETKTPKNNAKVEEAEAKPEKVKKEKPAKEAKQKEGGNSAFKAKVAAIVKTDNFKIFGIIAVSLLLVLVLSLSLVFGTMSCNPGLSDGLDYTPVDAINYDYGRFDDDKNFDTTDVDKDWSGVKSTAVTGGYDKGTALAQQTSQVLGTVDKIIKPVEGTADEKATYGVKEYPKYGSSLKNYTAAERDAIFEESTALLPAATWRSKGIYNGIDSEGYLIKNGARVADEKGGYKKLYAHTSSTTLYGGGLSDDEPRIIKQLTVKTHMKLASTNITGLYAPAGEVIRIDLSKSDYQNCGGLRIYIGQNYNLDQQVAMEKSGDGIKGTGLNRMTDILSCYALNDASKNVIDNGDGTVTAYVGSFLGGPIYFRPINNGVVRTVTIKFTGAVRYQNFILGVTTPEEYELDKASTAPYFDLEVFDAIRFTTHKYAASGGLALKDYTYENCTDAAILWDKIAEVSTRVGANGLSGSSAPVYVIGDCYIAAGAAFANPGRNGVVCPPSWLAEALNYKNFVNGGCWGTMHEYNHCWQGYGVSNNGEVTNNATTLISYSLYTRISQGRTAATGWGNGGWNRFTDPSKALADFLQQSASGNKCFDLPLYATLLHNIGQENFVKAAHGGSYMDNLVNATHYDMSYYFRDLMNFGVGDSYSAGGTIAQSQIDSANEKNYPMFVPVSSVYQVGRSIIYDNEKQYITTAQPYAYGNGEFVMDFNNHNNFSEGKFVSKSLVIPDGITAKVVSVTQPQNGTVELLDDNQVKYTPKSGEDGLYSGNFRVTLRLIKDDLRFIIEDVDLVINLKQSVNTTMTRTTYIYEEGKTPDPASVLNADKTAFDFGEYKETETIKNVCAQEVNTAMWATGRNYYDAVYSDKSTNYKVVPVNQTLQTMEGVLYFSSPSTVRFKLRGRGRATLYLSYDRGKTWTDALTLERPQSDKGDLGYSVCDQFREHEFTTRNNAVYYKVVHLVKAEGNYFGVGFSVKQADGTFSEYSHATAIPTSQIDLYEAVNAESAKKFETDYFFENEYKYSYTKEDKVWAAGQKMISCNRDSWDNDQQIKNLFDGDVNTYYHSKAGEANYITEENPFELIVDMNSVRRVNRVTFNGYRGNVGNNGMVKTFKIYGSVNGTADEDWFLVTEQTDSPANSKTMVFNFDTVEMRYYKLVVTKTDNGRYFAMKSIVFSNYVSYGGGKLVASNDFNVRYITAKNSQGWSTENVLCTFGIIYTANAGDSIEYHFTGTRFAYSAYRSQEYGTVDIYIDGKLVAEDVSLSEDNYQGASYALYDYFNVAGSAGSLAYIYTGDALENKEHTVKIVGKSGKFNLDSFVYWN